MVKPRVLFICLGNSCRSIMAEALTPHLCGERWEADSAGISPLGWVAPETLEALAEMGVSPEGLRSKGLHEVNLADYRLIVNLTHHPLGRLIPAAYADRLLHRPAPDPFGEALPSYRRSRDAIVALINREVCPRPGTPGAGPPSPG
jgi:arsenate reductase (thioredoxin)